MIGEQVGNYQIESLLGQGGMGAVYRARHITLGRPAAIKILLPQFASSPDIVRRFFNEAKASTSIHHLGIVEIYDFGTMANGLAYIAMELLRGESLADRLKHTQLSAAQALGLLRQICGALGAAHDIGIVHRDLKPDNVFIVPDAEVSSGERVKLLDFGIAKLSEEPGGLNRTRTGALMGTPTYMSPEQCRGVKVDHRSDIYSLGCILYELIAHRPPFLGEGVGDILGAHMYERQPPLTMVVAGSDPGVSALVDAMMAKDPADRPQTAAAVVGLIDRIASLPHANLGAAAAVPPVAGARGPTTTLSGATQARSRTSAAVPRVALIGAGVALSAALGASAYFLSGGHRGAASSTSSVSTALDAAVASNIGAVAAPEIADAGLDAPAKNSIRVKIVSVPPGADVVIDGVIQGVTPFNATRSSNGEALAVIVRKSGYLEQKLDVAAGSDIERSITLVPKRAGGGRLRAPPDHVTPPTGPIDAPVAPGAPPPHDDGAETVNPLRKPS